MKDQFVGMNENTSNEYRYFLELNFVGVNRLFVLVYKNQDDDVKRFKARRYYIPKGIIDDFIIIINPKAFMINQSFLI